MPRGLRQLDACSSVGAATRVSGRIWVHGGGSVEVGSRVFLDASSAPIELYAAEGARLMIGDDCVVRGGTSIEATSSVTIGARCQVDVFVKIIDNHFHALQGDRRERPPGVPVVVEDDVVLGPHSIVLQGVRVGRGARIAPRFVVRRHVPPLRVPDVSVVLATGADSNRLVDSARSALAQDGVVIELLLLDTGATGGASLDVLSDDRIALVRPARSAPSTAPVWADAVKAARGRYLHFLGAGEAVVAGAYRAHVDALEANPPAAMTFGAAWDATDGPDERPPSRREPGHPRSARLRPMGARPAVLFAERSFPRSACVVRRRVLGECALDGPPSFWEDARRGADLLHEAVVVLDQPLVLSAPGSVGAPAWRADGDGVFGAPPNGGGGVAGAARRLFAGSLRPLLAGLRSRR